MSTLILGGGVTGLAAAWHLQQRGEAVEVWEAGASVGGWMKTLPWEGGHFETGPQGVLWQKGSMHFWKWLIGPVALTLYAMGLVMMPLLFSFLSSW